MTSIPKAEPGLLCPLHRKDVSKVCHRCPWYLQIRGRNPNTGADVDNWGCAIGFLPMLLIENSMQTRGAAAATEDLRNNLIEAARDAVAIANNGRLLDAGNDHRR